MRSADFKIGVLDASKRADLFPIAPRGEGGVRGNERDFPLKRESHANASHSLLTDPNLDKPIRESVFKQIRTRRFREVCAKNNHLVVLGSRLDQALPIPIACRLCVHLLSEEVANKMCPGVLHINDVPLQFFHRACGVFGGRHWPHVCSALSRATQRAPP